MDILALKMGIDTVAIQLGLVSIVATARRGHEVTTMVREIGSTAVNTRRIRALDELARTAAPDIAPSELSRKVAEIDALPPYHAVAFTSVLTGMACGAFSFLNSGGALEILAATASGTLGQALRHHLVQGKLNQYAVFAICALFASATYFCFVELFAHSGIGSHPRHAAGLISSVLFLVPGFPLISALLDFLKNETTVALSRFIHAAMLLLMSALGFFVVIALIGFPNREALPPEFAGVMLLTLRSLASFIGAFGFAILFNGSYHNAFYVGLLAVLGNTIRLEMHDAGFPLPLTTFLGALAIGLTASLLRKWVNEPRISLTVPSVIMMVPGVYAFETLVLLGQDEILPALRTGILAIFLLGAMAVGLAVARFMSDSEELREH